MVNDSLQQILQDLQFMKFAGGSSGSGYPGDGGGGGGGSGGLTLEQLKQLTGGGGGGMSQQDRNNLRKCIDDLEDFTRKFNDMEEKVKRLESNLILNVVITSQTKRIRSVSFFQ